MCLLEVSERKAVPSKMPPLFLSKIPPLTVHLFMSLGPWLSWEAAHELPAQFAPEMSETLDHRQTSASEFQWKLEPQKEALTLDI